MSAKVSNFITLKKPQSSIVDQFDIIGFVSGYAIYKDKLILDVPILRYNSNKTVILKPYVFGISDSSGNTHLNLVCFYIE
jgi:hypothetical protein